MSSGSRGGEIGLGWERCSLRVGSQWSFLLPHLGARSFRGLLSSALPVSHGTVYCVVSSPELCWRGAWSTHRSDILHGKGIQGFKVLSACAPHPLSSLRVGLLPVPS